MKRVAIAAGALGFLVLAVAACGGGGSSSSSSSASEGSGSGAVTKAAYIEEADAVCAEGKEKMAPFEAEGRELEEVAEPESPQNLAKLAELLRGAAVQAEVEYEKLRELEPPAADEERIDAMIGKSEEGEELGLEGAEYLEEEELEGFSETAAEAKKADTAAKSMAQSYGFKVCGQEDE